IIAVERDTGEKIGHIVVMGTGEPFDNYDNIAKFIRLINAKEGLNIGMRNITVSTCGLVPKIEEFAKDFPQVNLAISLHAPNDAIRSSMMPVNNKYSIDTLLDACRKYVEITNRRITFEYTCVDGKNDSKENIEELASKLKGMLCHVNLIPLNKVVESGMEATTRKRAEEIAAVLEKKGIPATVRRELGADIDGACGQLRLSKK
ncbi:MAG: 23S rRNA (adenine(2503)-C(2))-methyltransferase RlmN, partial [Eubacterium sp.]|nr:23S rRNA (adenine(2503)-C(2))-methyltransferase RlmN [Eubacterium sp.]